MKKNSTLWAYFGHHKCASTWINSIISEICIELNLKHVTVYNPKWFSGNLQKFVIENQVDFLTYGNADFYYVQQLENYKGFHVVRDPRDVCVSAYFSHLRSHPTVIWPELIDHRKKLQALSQDEGLLLDMQFVKRFMDEMYSWDYATNSVLQYRMEDFTANPYQSFIEVLQFLCLVRNQHMNYGEKLLDKIAKSIQGRLRKPTLFAPNRLSQEKLRVILDKHSFTNKSGGRSTGTENLDSHYRKGISGDWLNHFKPEHVDYFFKHYNPVLLKLGYETDENWAAKNN